VIISRLKKEVAELKAELAMIKGEDVKDHLTSEDIDRCNKMVEEFIDTTDPSKTLVLADRLLINQCFYHFKHMYKDMSKKKGGSGGAVVPSGGGSAVKGSPSKDSGPANQQSQEEI
jgi:kinesin family protein 6/9